MPPSPLSDHRFQAILRLRQHAALLFSACLFGGATALTALKHGALTPQQELLAVPVLLSLATGVMVGAFVILSTSLHLKKNAPAVSTGR